MAEKIYYERSGTKIRKSFVVSESVGKRWDKFCKDIDCKSFPLDLALERFMSDVNEGRVEILLRFNKEEGNNGADDG